MRMCAVETTNEITNMHDFWGFKQTFGFRHALHGELFASR